MRVLKLSCPGAPCDADLSQYTGTSDNSIDGWQIRMNVALAEADAWFVMENVTESEEVCRVPVGNTVFVTAETSWPIGYYAESAGRIRFLQQFDGIYTCHDVLLPNTHATIPFLPWMINSNHGPSINAPHDRNLEYLLAAPPIEKTKTLSVFCSAQASTPGHRMRLRFVSALKEHFGDRLDWYGNGVNPLPEKWPGLAPYRYTIVIENHAAYNVITEKLLDAFLTDTYPIYYGAPNVSDYFDASAILTINIGDLSGSIAAIEALLAADSYGPQLPRLRENRRRVMTDYHYLQRMVKIAESRWTEDRRVRSVQSIEALRSRRERFVANSRSRAGHILYKLSK